MTILKPNPAKNWKIYKQTLDDGNIKYLTGKWVFNSFRGDSEEGYYTFDYTQQEGYFYKKKSLNIELVDNFIFNAMIKFDGNYRGRSAATFTFKDFDDINVYETGMGGMDTILNAIQDEKIPIINGYLHGDWTFKKQGSAYYFYPVD
jgi:hypothetical protein